MRECPFCAHAVLKVVAIEQDPQVFAVQCPECGATGPVSLSGDPTHAVYAWISAKVEPSHVTPDQSRCGLLGTPRSRFVRYGRLCGSNSISPRISKCTAATLRAHAASRDPHCEPPNAGTTSLN